MSVAAAGLTDSLGFLSEQTHCHAELSALDHAALGAFSRKTNIAAHRHFFHTSQAFVVVPETVAAVAR